MTRHFIFPYRDFPSPTIGFMQSPLFRFLYYTKKQNYILKSLFSYRLWHYFSIHSDVCLYECLVFIYLLKRSVKMQHICAVMFRFIFLFSLQLPSLDFFLNSSAFVFGPVSCSFYIILTKILYNIKSKCFIFICHENLLSYYFNKIHP